MNIATKTLTVPEKPEDDAFVEKLAEEAFGPGRFTRTAFRLREGVPHEADLSFVTWRGNTPIAAVRLTKIWIGEDLALLLGPLVVASEHKGMGHGAKLMETAVNAAKASDHAGIILVGDLPYYQRFGFEKIERGKIVLPGPVDPERLLICALKTEDAKRLSGTARPFL